ncbi:hypothetical protein GCM10009627_04690 [Curtobacterium herbarum]|uniref:Uncharacterized protein n=1 Tax=Curtobacterium herbarum TaxID=150122 RepID=A0ABP4K312_9MICO
MPSPQRQLADRDHRASGHECEAPDLRTMVFRPLARFGPAPGPGRNAERARQACNWYPVRDI